MQFLFCFHIQDKHSNFFLKKMGPTTRSNKTKNFTGDSICNKKKQPMTVDEQNVFCANLALSMGIIPRCLWEKVCKDEGIKTEYIEDDMDLMPGVELEKPDDEFVNIAKSVLEQTDTLKLEIARLRRSANAVLENSKAGIEKKYFGVGKPGGIVRRTQNHESMVRSIKILKAKYENTPYERLVELAILTGFAANNEYNRRAFQTEQVKLEEEGGHERVLSEICAHFTNFSIDISNQ